MALSKYSNPCKCLNPCSLSKINTTTQITAKTTTKTTIKTLQQPRKWDFDTNGNPYYTDLADYNKNHKNHSICQYTPIVSQLAKIEPKESRLTVKKPYPILK